VAASFDSLTCQTFSGTLGGAGAVTTFRDFAGAPSPVMHYPVALANAFAGIDLDPDDYDIVARFNSDVGSSGCLTSASWYYGFDGNGSANSFDLFDTVMHELAHGLGFASMISLTTGSKLFGVDDIFSSHLEDHRTGERFPQMTDAERLSASTATGSLHWVGTNVVNRSGFLVSGSSGGHVQMYAPAQIQRGSSVGHFDQALSPNELMEPFATDESDSRLTLELMRDIGWEVNAANILIVTNGAALVSETCVNGEIDPGERVTVSLELRNIGLFDSTNLTASIVPGGEVIPETGAQNFGLLRAGGTAAERSFTFLSQAECGSTLALTLQLADGGTSLGTVEFRFRAGGLVSFTNNGTITVPNAGAATPYPSTINVSGVNSQSGQPTVTLRRFSHSFPDDVDVLLQGPGGQAVMLMSDAGAGIGVSDLILTFDQSATLFTPDSAGLTTGTYLPWDFGPAETLPSPAPTSWANSLAVFDSQNPNGTWRLFVRDDANSRSGSIAGWSLTFPSCCGTAPPRITAISRVGSGVEITWQSNAGQLYQVQYSASLSGPWTVLPGNVTATGPLASKSDNPSALQARFYRVVALP
jgi:hypothetical protein